MIVELFSTFSKIFHQAPVQKIYFVIVQQKQLKKLSPAQHPQEKQSAI